MLYGLGGTITFPVGTLGAARQAEAIINSVRPGSAGLLAYIPPGIGDNDPLTTQMSVAGSTYDSTYVEGLIGSGDTTAVLQLLASSGVDPNLIQSTGAGPSTPIVLRDIGPFVQQANAAEALASSVASGQATGNVVTQVSAAPMPTPSNTVGAGQSMTSILSGSTFGLSNTTLAIGVAAIVAILFLEKD